MTPISVIGLGYIGLPTAAVFANRGVKVIGVDVNEEAVAKINSGEPHILEPDLDILVRAAVGSGNLKAVIKPEPAEAFLMAVPTPVRGDNRPDVSMVEAAARSIAPVLKKGNLVILESTSPVGTTELICRWLAEERPDLSFPIATASGPGAGEDADILVAHCPERVLPGQVLRELVENDRIVGGLSRRSTEASIILYKTFVQGQCIPTDARTAEMSKLTENSFRDINIAFANELSMICSDLSINVWELIALANRHPRVNILRPGPGVGGHCIAVDPWFIVDSAPERSRLIRTAREVNLSKTHFVVDKAIKLASKLKNPKVACLGLAFKPDIDDLRESPAIEVVRKLSLSGMSILAVEPHIDRLPKSLHSTNDSGGSIILASLPQALSEADMVLGLVAHKAFRSIDRSDLDEKIVMDTCGVWQ